MSDQLLKNMLVAEKQHKLPKKISIDDIQVPDTAPTKKKKKRKGSVNSATPQPSSNSSTLNNTKKKRKRKKTKSNQLDTIKTRKNSTSSTSSSPRKSSITPQKEPKEGKEPVLNLSTPKTKRKGKGKHGRQRSNSDFGIVAKQIIKHDKTDEIAPKKPKDDTYLTTNTTNTKKRTSTKKKKKKDNDPSVKSSKTKKNGRSSTLTPRPSSARSRSSSVSPSSSPSPKKKSITKSKSPKQSPSTPTVAKKPSTPKVSRMRSSSVASGRDSRPKQRSSSPRKSKKAKSARPKAPKLEKITADEENKADEWGKEKKDRVSSPIVIRINDKKYSGIATPKTPKKARAFANSKGKLDNKKRKELEQELKQQKLEYLKMQKMYREIKKDLNVLKQEKKVIEIEKRRLKKDQGKLQRDLEQFQVDQRTFGLKKENQGASGKKKHGIDDIDKLRKMLYSERKQFNEERKQYRSEILRLTNELTGLRHMDEKKRMSIYKQDIKHSFGNRNENKLKNRHNDGMDKYNVYNRQQKELTKFIQIEKQKAMKDLNAERRKLQILAKQLKADHQRLKMQQARTRNKWAPRTPRQDPALYVDKTVKKIYIKPRKQKPFRRQADIIKYQPVNTRIVYRDLRKKVVLRTTDWETKIKYINAKGKQLNTIKTKIITLEDKINKKHRGRKRKKVNKKARNRIPSVSTSQYQGGANNEGADDDNKDDNDEDDVDEQDNELDENEQEQQADPEIAAALQEIDELENEFMSIEQDIDKTINELEDVEEDNEEYKEETLVINEDIEKLEVKFEAELLKLEKEMSVIDPEFEKQVNKMESMVNEQAEEASTLRQVIESLSERLAQQQLENDNLRQQLDSAKRKQELRKLYMKMTYSEMPKYANLRQSHHRVPTQNVNKNNKKRKKMMNVDDAMGIIRNPGKQSPSKIMEALNIIQMNEMIENIPDKSKIIKPLLDIIRLNSKLMDKNPQNLQLVSNAMKAILPLLKNHADNVIDAKLVQDFIKFKGVDVYDDLLKCNNVYPVTKLIAETMSKAIDYAPKDEIGKINNMAIKICDIAQQNVNDLELLYEFGQLLTKIDTGDKTIDLMIKDLVNNGLLDISVSCALANKNDNIGVCDTFGLCHDYVHDDDIDIKIDTDTAKINKFVDLVDLYSVENTADVFPHVLDGILSLIQIDKLPRQLLDEFIEQGLEKSLIGAIDRNMPMNNNIEEKYEEDYGSDDELIIKFPKNPEENPIIESIVDFYNTLEFENLKPKMSQLKAKFDELDIPIYPTKDWIHAQKPNHPKLSLNNASSTLTRAKSPDTELLEELYTESKYEFDESDAMEIVKQRRDEYIKHPHLSDIGAFLKRLGQTAKDKRLALEQHQIGMTRRIVNDNNNNSDDNNIANNDQKQSKMSKLFSGMFKKKVNNQQSNQESRMSIRKLKEAKEDEIEDEKIPNRFKQNERLFLNNKQAIKYDDYMNEAFDNGLVGGKGGGDINEMQGIYNEMNQYTNLVKPVGSMLQKWYVLANHLTTYWVSPSNKELARFTEEDDEYFDSDLNEQEKYYDCWLLYDMKKKRMVNEIRWRNRGRMNDPKYIKVQISNDEKETPWSTINDYYLSNDDQEQKINVNARARFWRILFLGNYGEDTDEAPRFVFYEVQFWGKRHATMQYIKNKKYNIGHGDNAKKGKIYNNQIKINGQKSFKTVPSYK